MWFDGKVQEHYERGVAFIASRKYDLAMEQFTISLSYGPTAKCLVERAKLYVRDGYLEGVSADLKQARELSRNGESDPKLLREIEKLGQVLVEESAQQKAFEKDEKKALKDRDLETLLDLHGFASKKMLSWIKPGVRLKAGSSKCKRGQSKLGGLPDLPEGYEWPVPSGKKKAALSFIFQLNFAEFKPFCKKNGLPTDGILYYFYDAENQPWGSEKEDKFGSHLLYIREANRVKLRPTYPPGMSEVFSQQSLKWEEIESLPSPLDWEIIRLPLDDDRQEEYSDLYEAWQGYTDHQILGYPNIIQNPLDTEMNVSRKEWMFLMQIDSQDGDSDNTMAWGDGGGRLYLSIRKKDFEKHNFSNTRTVMQCT